MVGAMLASGAAASAQSSAPVLKLNLDQFTSPWYEQARLPDKREKPCVSGNAILYSLGDKKNSFQLVISCIIKNGNWEAWNQDGKLDPAGSGRLKLKWIWPFTRPYSVLATGGDMQWILVGTPNHKSLWLLSRDQQASPEVVAQMRTRAAAQGYDVSRLTAVVQHPNLASSTPDNARSQAPPTTPNSAP